MQTDSAPPPPLSACQQYGPGGHRINTEPSTSSRNLAVILSDCAAELTVRITATFSPVTAELTLRQHQQVRVQDEDQSFQVESAVLLSSWMCADRSRQQGGHESSRSDSTLNISVRKSTTPACSVSGLITSLRKQLLTKRPQTGL
eukprot:superscaffoldBa00008396_g23311